MIYGKRCVERPRWEPPIHANSRGKLCGLAKLEPQSGGCVVSPGRKTGVYVQFTNLRPRSGLVKHILRIVFNTRALQDFSVFFILPRMTSSRDAALDARYSAAPTLLRKDLRLRTHIRLAMRTLGSICECAATNYI